MSQWIKELKTKPLAQPQFLTLLSSSSSEYVDNPPPPPPPHPPPPPPPPPPTYLFYSSSFLFSSSYSSSPKILGYHLDPVRAAAKKEGRRSRALVLKRQALEAAREQEAFTKTSEVPSQTAALYSDTAL
jgi:hypothetical protein